MFHEGGVEFYRKDVKSPLYIRTLQTSDEVVKDGVEHVTYHYSYSKVASAAKLSESRVTDEADLLGQKLPPTQGQANTERTSSSCMRVEDSLVMSGHTLDEAYEEGVTYITIKGKGTLKLNLDRFRREHRETPEANRLLSSADLCVADLQPREWATVGISSIKAKDFYLRTDAMITISYSDADGKVRTGVGRLATTPKWAMDRGIGYHTANTVGGSSGSPVIMIKNGAKRLAGMHISAHPEGKVNVLINACALKNALVRLGVIEPPKKEDIVEQFNLQLKESSTKEGDFWMEDKADALQTSFMQKWEKEKQASGQPLWHQMEDDPEAEERAKIAFEAENPSFYEQETMGPGLRTSKSGGGKKSKAAARLTARNLLKARRLRESGPMETIEEEGSGSEAACDSTHDSEDSVEESIENTTTPPPPGLAEGSEEPASISVAKAKAEKAKARRLRRKEKLLQPQEHTGDSILEQVRHREVEKGLAQAAKIPLPGDLKAKRFWSRFKGDVPPRVMESRPKDVATEEDGRRLINMVLQGDEDWQDQAQRYTGESLMSLPSFAAYKNYCLRTREGYAKSEVKEIFAETVRGRKDLVTIGRYNDNTFRKAEKPHPFGMQVAKALRKHNREAPFEYSFPPSGKEAPLDSLKEQFKTHHEGKAELFGPEADPAVVQAFWHIVLRNAPTEEEDSVPFIGQGFAGFAAVAKNFDSKSSGWSARWVNKMKKETWETHWAELSLIVASRLIIRQAYLEKLPTWDAEQMWEHYCSDPKEGSVKDEAHNPSKVARGKWRLIWCSSLVDSMCQSLLHKRLNEASTAAYKDGENTYHCIGLGHDREGVKHLLRDVKRTFKRCNVIYGSDKSGWDLSVSRDSLMLDTYRRIHYSPEWTDAMLAEGFCNSAHLVAVSGLMLLVTRFGITASGVPSTTSQNSFVNGVLEVACGSHSVKANGDDILTSSYPDAEKIKKYGPIIKEGSITVNTPDKFEYTSHGFEEGKEVVFLNGDKAFAKLLHKPFDEQVLQSLAVVMRGNHEDLAILKDIALFIYGTQPHVVEKWSRQDYTVDLNALCD